MKSETLSKQTLELFDPNNTFIKSDANGKNKLTISVFPGVDIKSINEKVYKIIGQRAADYEQKSVDYYVVVQEKNIDGKVKFAEYKKVSPINEEESLFSPNETSKGVIPVIGNLVGNVITAGNDNYVNIKEEKNLVSNWQEILDAQKNKDKKEKSSYKWISARIYNIEATEFAAKKTGKIWRKFEGVVIDKNNKPFNIERFGIKEREKDRINKLLKRDDVVRLRGRYQKKTYRGVTTEFFEVTDIIKSTKELYSDLSGKTNRYELSAHTQYSQMEAISKPGDLFKMGAQYGLSGIALTDSSSVQAYADSINASKNYSNIKPIFGVQLNEILQRPKFVINPNDEVFIDENNVVKEGSSFVAFDIETTGFSPKFDDIIQMSAVRLERMDEMKFAGRGKNRHEEEHIVFKVVDKLDEIVHTNKKLPKKITELTHISQEDVDNSKISQEQAVLDFKKFVEDTDGTICIGHNVQFDYYFINQKLKDYGHNKLPYEIFDTLTLARRIIRNARAYNLTALCKKLHIPLDKAHNSLYDCEATGRVFFELINLATRGIQTDLVDLQYLKKSELKKKEDPDYPLWKNGNDIHNSEPSSHAYQEGFPYHVDLLAKNQTGIEDLYKLISIAHTKHYYREPRIFLQEILDRREDGNNFLFGSGDSGSRLFEETFNRGYERGLKIAKKFKYDYIEIVPFSSLQFDDNDESAKEKYNAYINNMLKIAKEINAIPVIISDSHYTKKDDKGAYDILKKIAFDDDKANLSLKNPMNLVDELQEFIDDKSMLKDIIYNNTNKIVSQIDLDNIQPIHTKLTPPELPGAEEELREKSWKRAHELYGEKLDPIVEQRITKELDAIIHNGYAVIYLVAKRLVDISNSKGYLVGSRGSVGGSFVAYLVGITEVNSLPPHYRSKHGDYFEWADAKVYNDGFDLPKKEDPNHPGEYLLGDGHGCTFEIFTGVAGKKVPDIDLNFASEIQHQAQLWLKDKIFDDKHAFRVGTISALQSKSAFGLVKNYEREQNKEFSAPEENIVVDKLVGVKKTSGMHAAGVLIVPQGRRITEFTPYTYPANDLSSNWLTTQFTKGMMHDSLLKMDCLGHDDPTMLHHMQEMTGIDPKSIEQTEIPEVVEKCFCSKDAVRGLPEFGTGFSSQIVEDAKPKTFSDLVQVSGISHGEGVWVGNAQDLILGNKEKGIKPKATLHDVIASRDKIMNDMMNYGWPLEKAFKLVTIVKKQKQIPPEMEEEIKEMYKDGLPSWYLESLKKVKYLYPAAHAVAYVYSAVRIAWYKLHYPKEFYASWLSYRIKDKKYDMKTILTNDVNVYNEAIDNAEKLELTESQINGIKMAKDAISVKTAIDKNGKEYDAQTKFAHVDLIKSEANRWTVNHDDGLTYPAISTLDNISSSAAEGIKDYINTFNTAPVHSKELKDFGVKLQKKMIATLVEEGLLED